MYVYLKGARQKTQQALRETNTVEAGEFTAATNKAACDCLEGGVEGVIMLLLSPSEAYPDESNHSQRPTASQML